MIRDFELEHDGSWHSRRAGLLAHVLRCGELTCDCGRVRA